MVGVERHRLANLRVLEIHVGDALERLQQHIRDRVVVVHLLGEQAGWAEQHVDGLVLAIPGIRQPERARGRGNLLGQTPDGAGGQVKKRAADLRVERKRLETTFVGRG